MGVRRALEKLVADAVRAEVGRTLERAVAPVRAQAEEVIAETARRAAAPFHARIERVVGEAVEQAGDVLLKAVWPGKPGTAGGKRRR